MDSTLIGQEALARRDPFNVINGLSLWRRIIPMSRARLVAFILCLPISSWFGIATLFAVMHYANYGSTVPLFIRYILIPGTLAILFLGCAIFLRESTSILIGVHGTAILIGLFAFESLMTFRTFSVEMDMLGRIRTASPKEGLLASVPLKAMNAKLEVDSLGEAMLSAIPHGRTLLCAKDGVPLTYDADRFGFNNPDHLYERAVDVVVLGDSFIEGMCQAPGEDVVSRLRERYPGSINMAVRGNGPLLELAALGRYGPAVRPRRVIVAFFEGNDWRNFGLELALPWLRAALMPGVEFGPIPAPAATLGRARQVAQHSAEREITAWAVVTRGQNLRNFFALKHATSALGLLYPRALRDRPEYVEVLRRAKAITATWGGRLSLLYIPRPDRFMGLLPRDFAFDPLRTEVRAAAREAGVEVVDLVPRFAEDEAPRRFYAPDGHFSEEGARRTAQILAEHIAQSMAAEATP